MRFFRLNLDTSVEYEAIRASVDSQIGFSGSLTCISPYATAPQDQKGRVLLSLTDNQPGYDALLSSFLALVLVKKAKELTQDEYDASFFPVPTGGGGGGVSSWNDLTDKPTAFPAVAVGVVTPSISYPGWADSAPNLEEVLTAISTSLVNKVGSSPATTSTLGLIKVGPDLNINSGVLSSRTHAIYEFNYATASAGATVHLDTPGDWYLQIPAGAKLLRACIIGAGGGGGGGGRRASTTVSGSGGGGGTSGCIGDYLISVAEYLAVGDSYIVVHVGTGGPGGAGAATATGSGGQAGGGTGVMICDIAETLLQRYWNVSPGTGGGGGSGTTLTYGSSGNLNSLMGTIAGFASGQTRTLQACAPGGRGGLISNANTMTSGDNVQGVVTPSSVLGLGADQGFDTVAFLPGAGSSSAGALGGFPGDNGQLLTGGGGGGPNNAGTGGAGGNGGIGGGGGGGGPGTSPGNGGAGGSGGDGFVRLTFYF